MQELNIFTSHDGLASQSTYIAIDRDVKHHIKRHVNYLRKRNIKNVPEEFPFLYWIPKMHKKPFSKTKIYCRFTQLFDQAII